MGRNERGVANSTPPYPIRTDHGPMVLDPGQLWGMAFLAPAAEDTDLFSMWSMRHRERNIQPLIKT